MNSKFASFETRKFISKYYSEILNKNGIKKRCTGLLLTIIFMLLLPLTIADFIDESNYQGGEIDKTKVIVYEEPLLNQPAISIISTDGQNDTNSILDCSVIVTGLNKNTTRVLFEWYNGSNLIIAEIHEKLNLENEVHSLLAPGNTSKGDIWSCRVKVYEGVKRGIWMWSLDIKILDSPPTLFNIYFDDNYTSIQKEIDPVPSTTTHINCNAVVEDEDGVLDIKEVEANFYLTSVGVSSPLNYETHYRNNSCDINFDYGNLNQASINCSTELFFYASPGNWTCNIQVVDKSLRSSHIEETSTLTELLSIEIGGEGDIEYGPIAVGENTGLLDFVRKINNTGNVNVSIKLNVWGTSLNDQKSMGCMSGYTLPSDMRVATNESEAYYSRIKLTSTNDEGTDVGIIIPKQTSGTQPSQTTIYLGMGVSPDADPRGACSGNIMISAIKAT